MMKFTFGAMILVFAVVIGGYQLLQNQDLIEARSNAIRNLEQRIKDNQSLLRRLEQVRTRTMQRGQDQKFDIERLLQIGEPGLAFEFQGRPERPGNSDTFYRHGYRISGLASFEEAHSVARQLSSEAGFTIHRFCYSCARTPRDARPGQEIVEIEGFLYVYDPETL